VPLPDMSTAILAFSGIMRCFPGCICTPYAGPAFHGAAAGAFHDPADGEYLFASLFQLCGDCGRKFRLYRQHHADPAIERPRHFARRDVPLALEEGHEAGLFPRAGIDDGMGAFGQDARHVFQQAAAGDVRQCIDLARADGGQQAFDIDPGRLDQRIDQQPVRRERTRPGATRSPVNCSPRSTAPTQNPARS